ncbi:MAG: methionyl-tRNA formyltransferase, partial [Acidimicrobiales bacterium]
MTAGLVLPPPPLHPRRLAYLGSPATAVGPLDALVEAGWPIGLVVSQPDRRRGRGSALVPSPVKAAAVARGLAVSDRADDLLDAGVDLAVVVAYGRLIKADLLTRLPFVNLHFSLLPRWRGAAPVERAILAGDARTGVCLMQIEEGLDTGGVYRSAAVDIGPDETAAELRGRLAQLGVGLLLAALRDGFGPPAPQVGEAVYAPKIDPAELELDWARPAAELHRVVRVGGAWTMFRGRRLKVLRARLAPSGERDAARAAPGELVEASVGCGVGALVLLEVQPEGRAAQSAAAWRN